MKKLLVALTVSIMFFGCMGGSGRSLSISDPDPDPQGKVNKEALCDEAIEDTKDAFNSATIKTTNVKAFFLNVKTKCEDVIHPEDYIEPIAELIEEDTNACGCPKSFVASILNELESTTSDRSFEDIISFPVQSQLGLCAMPAICSLMGTIPGTLNPQ
ncbi:MAG TPA: hypothetical protein PK443_01530 [bacterium]|nr:hypothetical protein [bacterium]